MWWYVTTSSLREEVRDMPRKRHSTEQIIHKLRQAEVELSRGKAVSDVCKQLGITDQTYYRWRKEYGSLSTDQARQLKELQRENSRLKKVVADLALDNAILKEAANPNF
jgi:putative transposase